MKILIIFLSLILAGISLSCKKEEMIIPDNNDALLVKKVVVGDHPYNEYLYETNDLLIEERGRLNFISHRYNDKNQLVVTDYYSDIALLSNDPTVAENALNRKELFSTAKSEIKGTLTYNYGTSGQLIKTIFSLPTGGYSENSEFTYNSNGRIDRQTLYWNNKVAGYISYLYDLKGNLTKESLYSVSSSGIAELNTTTQYEYDNKKNPFQVFYVLMIPGVNTNSNNVIKETLTIHFKPGQGTDLVQVTLTSYTYNSNGYPVRKNGTVEFIYE